MAKQLEFDDLHASRRARRRRARQRRQGDARPRAATSSSTRSGVPPPSPTTASRSPARSSSRIAYENLAPSSPSEVATKTNDIAGDGTTTATVLAQAMVKEGLRNVAAGAAPASLKRGMDKAVTAVNDRLLRIARDVNGKEEISSVATLSAQDTLGGLIGEAFEKVGKDGSSPSRSPRRRRPSSEFTEACSSTRATSRPTSSPTPSAWRRCSRTPMSSSTGQGLGRRRPPARAREGRPVRQAAA